MRKIDGLEHHNIRIESDLWRAIERCAGRQGADGETLSISAFIRVACREKLAREETNPKRMKNNSRW